MMRRNMRNYQSDMANRRERFSIRKLSIGAASVLLGTTLFMVNSGHVQASVENGGVR